MNYRNLGKTGLSVSEIGFGGEWLERHPEDESVKTIQYAESLGINIIDCWMPDPKSRNIIGKSIHEHRDRWIVQGHLGSCWKDNQYYRTRDLSYVKPAFEDLLGRLQTDYIDLGMIHYVDDEKDFENAFGGPFLDYVLDLKNRGVIRHIGMSTHNPQMAIRGIQTGIVEMVLFSINPAFDMMPVVDLDTLFDVGNYNDEFSGIDPDRAAFYRAAEENNIGITVMKPFAGGRLLGASRSPFGTAMTPVQCIHYCLTRPGVSSVLCGYDDIEQVDAAAHYETATDEEKNYAAVIASAPKHSYVGQCTYCGHCKPCPVKIDIAMVNKYYDLATAQTEIPSSVRSHYELLEHHASECISCHACEKRCPFGVKVADRMHRTAELFGV
jgi:predicted aldo/keto reductase-like oxidoreductase